MKLSNKTYDVLKWVCLTFFPALIALYGVIGATLNLPLTEEIITIAAALNTFLGTCLGVSSINYHRNGGNDND